MSTYQELYDRVGSQIGWDFSSVKTTKENVKWQLYDLVAKHASTHPFLLDLGAGGGHRLLKIADQFSLVIGIDSAASMIKTAHKNLKKTSLKQTKFLQMKNEAVQFPDKFFDIISCRHAPFSASEVFRLLRSGGIFLCQNVTEEDKINIKQAFGRGQNYGLPDGKLLKKDVKKLNKAGFTQIKTDQYNAVVYYQAPKDLLFTLKNTPIIMDFGSKDTDLELFKKFIKENTTNKGIVTNSSRSLIVAKK